MKTGEEGARVTRKRRGQVLESDIKGKKIRRKCQGSEIKFHVHPAFSSPHDSTTFFLFVLPLGSFTVGFSYPRNYTRR